MEILNLPKGSKIHFIGIGGVSMSSLATICLSNGYLVSGSDVNETKLTTKLRENGAHIYIGQKAENINSPDAVVYTAAINSDNPEFIAAKETGIPFVERSVFLGELMKIYAQNCCVSGTHGKTTTTAMVALVMLEAGIDPTILVGGEVKELSSNYKIGSNNMLVTESCEYVESFLKFYPKSAIINNIEEDHLDYFKDLEHIKSSFRKFAELVPDSGFIIANGQDENVLSTLDGLNNVKYFGIDGDFHYKACNLTYNNIGFGEYDLYNNDEFLVHITLNVPGEHNVLNSLGAAAICHCHGCDINSIAKGLNIFKGTGRRFEYIGTHKGAEIFDDYAHHPTEIKTTLKACRNYGNKKVIAIFQPHTYTRTKALFNEFLDAFNDADELILTDIYAAREKDTGIISSSMLAEALKEKGVNVRYIASFDEIVEYLNKKASPDHLIITIGAGDVYKISSLVCQDA